MRRALSLIAVLLSGCSGNLFEKFADTKTDAALYQKALLAIDQSDFNGALGVIAGMTSDAQASRSVVNLKASAYGGLCGLNFLGFVQSFTNIGTARLFPFLLQQFAASNSARLDACVQAQTLLTSIGDANARTDDENIFLAFVSLAKIGNFLDYYTDADANGVADAGVDVCQNTRTSRPAQAVAGNFFDADLREVGTGLTLALTSLNAVASLTSLGQSTMASVTTLCAQLPANFCGITDPTAFTTFEVFGIQTLIKEGAILGLGIGACNGQDLSVCHCP